MEEVLHTERLKMKEEFRLTEAIEMVFRKQTLYWSRMINTFCNNTNCLLSVKVSAGEEWFAQIKIFKEDLMKELVIKIWAEHRVSGICHNG